jgi:hypothetical protein
VDQGHIFYEKVQRPENYLSIIKNKIIELNKKEYKNINDLIKSLNKKLGIEKKLYFLKHNEKLNICSSGYCS